MLVFDEDYMSDILLDVDKNIQRMSNMEDGYMTKMNPIRNSGMYGNGIETIDSQIVAIKDGLTDFRNITRDNANYLKESENKLKSEVSLIQLPKDFDSSDSGLSLGFNSISLTKSDGLKINTNDINEATYDDSSVINSETIYNLTKGDVETSNLSDYVNSKEVSIRNITKSDVKESNLEDYKLSKGPDISNIAKDNIVTENEIEDYKKAKDIDIKELNNSIINEINDSYIIEKKDLKDLGDGSEN